MQSTDPMSIHPSVFGVAMVRCALQQQAPRAPGRHGNQKLYQVTGIRAASGNFRPAYEACPRWASGSSSGPISASETLADLAKNKGIGICEFFRR